VIVARLDRVYKHHTLQSQKDKDVFRFQSAELCLNAHEKQLCKEHQLLYQSCAAAQNCTGHSYQQHIR
jgi:hypothetical protein